MLHLLLVDDEIATRQRVFKSVCWEDYGISEIVQADDGEDALEKCDSFAPDILLTDVRMPVLDGVHMAIRIAQRFPHIKIIFISGYTDKEYLKSAISLGAVGYIEKPIQISELISALQITVKAIRDERLHHDILQSLALKDELLKSEKTALLLTHADPEGFAEVLKNTPGLAACSMFITVMVKITSSSGSYEELSLYEKLANCVNEMQRSFALPDFHFFCTCSQNPMIVHLAAVSTGLSFDDYKAVSKFCSLLLEKTICYCVDAVIGIGEFVRSLQQLPHSYETAALAIQQAFFQEAGCVCYYKNSSVRPYEFTQDKVAEFAHALKKETGNQAVLYLHNFTAEVKQYQNTLRANVLRHYYALACALIHAAQDNLLDVFEEVGQAQDVWVYINSFSFIDQLRDFLIQGVGDYFSRLNGGQYENVIVQRIIKYIRNNYWDPELSITSISECSRLSPTYICHIFKETTGLTINKFIFQCRMQKAQLLIKEPTCKVGDVAKLVGYRNGNYFSLQFKKHMGCSPSEYRGSMQ